MSYPPGTYTDSLFLSADTEPEDFLERMLQQTEHKPAEERDEFDVLFLNLMAEGGTLDAPTPAVTTIGKLFGRKARAAQK